MKALMSATKIMFDGLVAAAALKRLEVLLKPNPAPRSRKGEAAESLPDTLGNKRPQFGKAWETRTALSGNRDKDYGHKEGQQAAGVCRDSKGTGGVLPVIFQRTTRHRLPSASKHANQVQYLPLMF